MRFFKRNEKIGGANIIKVFEGSITDKYLYIRLFVCDDKGVNTTLLKRIPNTQKDIDEALVTPEKYTELTLQECKEFLLESVDHLL